MDTSARFRGRPVLDEDPYSGFKPCGRLGDYQFLNVFQRTTPPLRAAIAALWHRHRILPPNVDPLQRAHQVAVAIIRNNDTLVGVSTVYQGVIRQPQPAVAQDIPVYFYRMFIQPQDRVPELMRKVTNATFAILQALHRAGQAKGMAIVSENRKLMRPGLRRKLERNGYVLIGQNAAGQDVILRRFN